MQVIQKIILSQLIIFSLIANAIEEDLADSYGDEDFVSIATGQSQLISKAPAVASVITAKDIKAMGATDIDEVLETVPGLHVAVNEFYNPIYTIRGIYSKFNPQVLILVNGIPISNLFVSSRGAVWAGMPVESITRIEVIRGPGSAVYGADAFAGTINIITKDKTHIQGTEVGIGGGSFDTQSAWINHGDQWGDFDIATSLQYTTTDGHREIIDSDLQTILDGLDGTSASLAPGPVNLTRDSIDLRLDISKGYWKTRLGLQERDNIGTGAGVAEALDPMGRFKSSRRNFDLTYDNPNINENWQLYSQLSYFHTTQEVDRNLILFPPGSELGLNGAPFTDGVIGNPEMFEDHWRLNTSAFYSGLENHIIRVGAGKHRGKLSEVKESKNFGLDGNGNPILPGSPIVSVDDTPFIFLPEDDRDNSYLFIQDIWQFSNDWELTSGIRYDDYSDFGHTINPRLALVWSTSNNLTTKFLYGSAFRAPSFSETRNQNNPVALGNLDLKPEEIETFEIAFDYKPNYDIRLGINLFSYTWNDIIDFVPDPSPATTTTAQNEGKQTGEGIELELDWNFTSNLNLVANYAYQKSTIDNTNSISPNSPEQQIYFRLNWEVSSSYKIVGQLNSVKDRSRNFGDTRENIDNYSILNLTLNYQKPSSPWELRFTGRNILDEDAREPSSTSIQNDFPLAGKNYYIDIRYKF